MEKPKGWGLVSASGFPRVPSLLPSLSPPARGGQDPAAPARPGKIEHPCAAYAEETPKGFPGREVPSPHAVTSTSRSWGRSPALEAGESGSTERMNCPGRDFSLCRLKP